MAAEVIGPVLRHHRERLGLSQRAVARRAGLKGTTVSRVETGESQPTWTTVRALAAALDEAGARAVLAAAGLEGPAETPVPDWLHDAAARLAAMTPARAAAIRRAILTLVRLA